MYLLIILLPLYLPEINYSHFTCYRHLLHKSYKSSTVKSSRKKKNKNNKINFPETAIANWFVTVLKKFLNTVSVSPGITELILAQLTL